MDDGVRRRSVIDLVDQGFLGPLPGRTNEYSVLERMEVASPEAVGPMSDTAFPRLSSVGVQRIVRLPDLSGQDSTNIWVCEATLSTEQLSINRVLAVNQVASRAGHREVVELREQVGPIIGQDLSGWEGPFVLSVVSIDSAECARVGWDPERTCLALSEHLCVGIGPTTPPDNSLGHDPTTQLPTGVSRRASGWYYYTSRRRFGSVLVADTDGSRYRQSFAGEFSDKFTGPLSIALTQHFVYGRCRTGLAELRSLDPDLRLDWLKWQTDLALAVELRGGSGLVSTRHGVQLFFEQVATGLSLRTQRQDIRELLQTKADMIQAEYQQAETESQRELDNTVRIAGSFVAGSFGFLSLLGSVEWDGTYNVIGLGQSSSDLAEGGTTRVLATAVAWGVIVLLASMTGRRLFARFARRRRTRGTRRLVIPSATDSSDGSEH
jgi:hypothetical protein